MHALNNLLIEFYDKMSSWEQSVVKDTGYSLAQVHTIEVLGSHGAMRMKELAERLGITTGTLTVQVDKLVKRGLIIRQAHQQDRRSILVGLSEEGHQLHQQHNKMHMQLTRDITRHLSDNDTQVLIHCLETINRDF